jgi:hypothetical protein
VKELVERETYESEKNLAGYTTRKIDANNVMFHKEVMLGLNKDILAMHQAFLSKPPGTIYPELDSSPKDELEDTITLLEQKLQKLDLADAVE